MPAYTPIWNYINLLVLFFSISANVFIRFIENNIGDDALMQIASAQALRQGYGVSILYANIEDLAKVSPRVVEFWPPGYAMIGAAFLQLTGKVELVHFFIDVVGIALFFAGWFLIAVRLIPFTTPVFPALMLLPWAFGFLFKWTPATDLLAIGFYIFSMASLLEYIASADTRIKVIWLVVCALSVYWACLIRFAYYPLAFMPALVLLAGRFAGYRTWWRPGLLLFGLTALLVASLVLYQHFIAGSVNYVSERHAASQHFIHWYNLRQFTPFLTKAIPGASLLPFSEELTDVLLLLVLVAGCTFLLRKHYKNISPAKPQEIVFIWLGIAVSAFVANVVFMVFLSLRYPPEAWGPWTYVQEVRYFGLNMATASCLLLMLLLLKNWPFPTYVQYAFKAVAIFIFVYSYAFGTFKIRVHDTFMPKEPLESAATIRKWVANSPGKVVFSSDQVHNYWDNVPVTSMGMYGAMAGASICHIETLLKPHFRSQPITLLVAIVHAPPQGLEKLYQEGKAEQVGIVGQGIPLMRLTLPASSTGVPAVSSNRILMP